MGVEFGNIIPRNFTVRYIKKCVFCEKLMYSGDIVTHTIKCSETFSSDELKTNQKLTNIVLHFLGFKKHIEIDYNDSDVINAIIGLYVFFYRLRETNNIKNALKYIEVDRFTYMLINSLSEEIRSYNIPIYPSILANFMCPQSDESRYYNKISDYHLNKLYKYGSYNSDMFFNFYPKFNPSDIESYQDGIFYNE